MKNENNYLIPAGTKVKTRNVLNQLRMTPYVTQQPLLFEEVVNTGDGGLLCYFQHGDWLIAVDAQLVLRDSETVLAAPAA